MHEIYGDRKLLRLLWLSFICTEFDPDLCLLRLRVDFTLDGRFSCLESITKNTTKATVAGIGDRAPSTQCHTLRRASTALARSISASKAAARSLRSCLAFPLATRAGLRG